MPKTATMLMDGATTISDFVAKYNSEEITYSAFFLKKLFSFEDSHMVVNDSNLLVKYMPELKRSREKITLTESEYRKYAFNPKAMSYEVYQTTELWFLILHANELHTISQFDMRTLYIYTGSILDKMSRVLNLEVDAKNLNEAELSASLIGLV